MGRTILLFARMRADDAIRDRDDHQHRSVSKHQRAGYEEP
jgi:hypothetical protein